MSRLIIPEAFAEQQTLLEDVLTKHTSLGTKSPLPPLLKKQKLDVAVLQASLSAAAAQNTDSGNMKLQSEMDTQHRNLALAVPWANFLGEIQFLKSLNAGMERDLGEWGITIDGKSRVVLPTGVAAQVDLIQTFIAHHKSFALGESPLQWYLDEHDIDVDADLQSAANALTEESERNTTTGDGQLATQMRNKIWAPSVKALHLIGAYLMNLYHEDSRKMAAWGFKVVEDAAGEVLQTSMLDPLENRVQKSVAIPSVFTNVGEDDLQLMKGAKADGKMVTVKPGGQLGMTKGYSTITVYNPSSLVMGKYTITINR